MNKFLTFGIVSGLAFGAYKLITMKNVSDKMVSNLSNPRVHKLDLTGITFRTEIKIKNPTQDSMSITKPVVILSTNGKYIASNNPEQTSFTIKPLATTDISTIELSIPWSTMGSYISGVLTKVPALIAAFKKKDKTAIAKAFAIPMEMKYSLYANGIYFESTPQKIM